VNKREDMGGGPWKTWDWTGSAEVIYVCLKKSVEEQLQVWLCDKSPKSIYNADGRRMEGQKRTPATDALVRKKRSLFAVEKPDDGKGGEDAG